MDIPILFENDDFLVVNKPPGVVVNTAESVKTETIQEWMAKRFDFSVFSNVEGGIEFINRAGIVHRIDKETSGILLIAKTPSAFYELQRQFKERLVKKTYIAIVHGFVEPKDGEVKAPVGRLPWNKERFGIVPGGKESVTKYHVLKELTRDDERYSVLELHPETGRTHQIRVHMKYMNHPLLGDYLYAGRKTSRNDRMWATRVMLHAWKIQFLNPKTSEPIELEAKIPDDMNRIIL